MDSWRNSLEKRPGSVASGALLLALCLRIFRRPNASSLVDGTLLLRRSVVASQLMVGFLGRLRGVDTVGPKG